MSYDLGSVHPDERAGGVGASSGGGMRLLARGILSSALVLLVMAAFAGGVWFAHFASRRQGGGAADEAPLLRADSRPFKIRPAAPGGMAVPDQNMLVYGERHDTVEHLLPPPEAPMPRPTPPPPPKPSAAAPSPPPQAASSQPSPAGPAVAPAPTAAPPAAPPSSAAPTTAMPVSETPAPETASPPPAPLHPAIAKTGGVRLQLGAVRDPEAARREWQRLKRANADLLGDVAGFAVRADLGAKGIYYRIETAPLADPAVAARICGALKRRGAGCILGR
ncbi:MAG TPA: SPOR domain-containing protein [Stellaceae bacterium]|nr:SPOR domain-containing protein [Stellaceae bacterium]